MCIHKPIPFFSSVAVHTVFRRVCVLVVQSVFVVMTPNADSSFIFKSIICVVGIFRLENCRAMRGCFNCRRLNSSTNDIWWKFYLKYLFTSVSKLFVYSLSFSPSFQFLLSFASSFGVRISAERPISPTATKSRGKGF